MEALRAIEASAEKKARHPFSSSKGRKKRKKPPQSHADLGFWQETDSVVSSDEI